MTYEMDSVSVLEAVLVHQSIFVLQYPPTVDETLLVDGELGRGFEDGEFES